MRQAERDQGLREGMTSETRERLKALERENRELRQANEILRKAQRVFCAGGVRPPVQAMIAFIDDHRGVHGVEPICRVLPIAPSTYHSHAARRAAPAAAPPRVRRDAGLREHIRRVWEANFPGLRCPQGLAAARPGGDRGGAVHRELTVLGYATLTMFDALALHYLGKDVHFHRTALASFIGYAFAHSLGFAVLSGGAVRYRLYSAWGLSAFEVGAIVAFNSMTTFLGLASLIGLACLGAPSAIGALFGVPAAVITSIGMLLVAVVVGYHMLTIVVRAPFRIRRWQLRLPSPKLALLQTLMSLLDWSLAALALYVLLPADLSIGFFVLLGIFALANLGGLISHVPGGIGVFEGLMLLAIPSEGHLAGVAAALIAYCLIYYALPRSWWQGSLLGAYQLLSATDTVGTASADDAQWQTAPTMTNVRSSRAGA